MGKNASAAKARDGGNAQGTTAPSTSSQAAANSTSIGTQVVDPSGPAVTGSLSATGTSDTSTSSSTSDAATQAAGNQVQNSGSETSGLQDNGSTADSSAENNTVAVGGSGENFVKMLAASLRSTAGLKVTSSQDGFRRAGRAWTTTPTVIALSELTDDQVKLLKAEPMLSVQLVDLVDEEA